MSRAVDLGVPAHAVPAWHRLLDELAAVEETPCAGAGRDRWQGNGHQQRAAADACMSCPVLRACADYADAAGEQHGVWGGYTARERQHRRGEHR